MVSDFSCCCHICKLNYNAAKKHITTTQPRMQLPQHNHTTSECSYHNTTARPANAATTTQPHNQRMQLPQHSHTTSECSHHNTTTQPANALPHHNHTARECSYHITTTQPANAVPHHNHTTTKCSYHSTTTPRHSESSETRQVFLHL